MPAITALLHARNDALRLGRSLETLLPCDEILVIDHASQDVTARVAREYGARVFSAPSDSSPSVWLQHVRHPWILCLEAHESLTEALVASLFEWKTQSLAVNNTSAFSILVREETSRGWLNHPTPQTRLVPRSWRRWQGLLPDTEPDAILLDGSLLRFVFPK